MTPISLAAGSKLPILSMLLPSTASTSSFWMSPNFAAALDPSMLHDPASGTRVVAPDETSSERWEAVRPPPPEVSTQEFVDLLLPDNAAVAVACWTSAAALLTDAEGRFSARAGVAGAVRVGVAGAVGVGVVGTVRQPFSEYGKAVIPFAIIVTGRGTPSNAGVDGVAAAAAWRMGVFGGAGAVLLTAGAAAAAAALQARLRGTEGICCALNCVARPVADEGTGDLDTSRMPTAPST